MRVGVIFGGRSGEHDVSLMSARSVMSALDRAKYELAEIGITPDGEWYMGEGLLEAMSSQPLGEYTRTFSNVTFLPDPIRPGLYMFQDAHLEFSANLDVVLPILHGTFGEDGTLQGLFELADIAYVGAGVLGSAVGMDKALFKDVMKANGIPVV